MNEALSKTISHEASTTGEAFLPEVYGHVTQTSPEKQETQKITSVWNREKADPICEFDRAPSGKQVQGPNAPGSATI